MVYVIASIRVEAGRLSEYLETVASIVPLVREEKGCVAYLPTVDIAADLPPQVLDENTVTIIEKWENLAALRNHLNAPHMTDYREKVNDIVAELSLKVLQEA